MCNGLGGSGAGGLGGFQRVWEGPGVSGLVQKVSESFVGFGKIRKGPGGSRKVR